MYRLFSCKPWAMYHGAIESTAAALKQAIAAGPVEDAGRAGLQIKKHGSAAVVSMRGPMVRSAGWMAKYGIAGTRDTAIALKVASADPDVESILWLVDSPGGSVDGLDELAETVRAVAAIKPINVQVDGMMASAAVYVTAGATTIHANRRDLIGSIGVRMMLYDYSAMFAREGVRAIPIDTGEHKSAGAAGTTITEAQQAEFQRLVDGFYGEFLRELELGRGISRETLEPLADGRVFFADEEPITSGLIDGIRSTDDAFAGLITTQSTRRVANAKLKLLNI